MENSEGSGEVVAVGMLLNETEEYIWFIKTFKRFNVNASDISHMSDKHNKETHVFKKPFPTASLQICLFRTLQIFNSEVSTKKMDLSRMECEVVKDYLQMLAYTPTEERYLELYIGMMNNIPVVVMDYVEENWGTN